jgi:hypothetical protein
MPARRGGRTSSALPCFQAGMLAYGNVDWLIKQE